MNFSNLKLGDVVNFIDGSRKIIAIDYRTDGNTMRFAFESDEENTVLNNSYYIDSMDMLEGYESSTHWTWVVNDEVIDALKQQEGI